MSLIYFIVYCLNSFIKQFIIYQNPTYGDYLPTILKYSKISKSSSSQLQSSQRSSYIPIQSWTPWAPWKSWAQWASQWRWTRMGRWRKSRIQWWRTRFWWWRTRFQWWRRTRFWWWRTRFQWWRRTRFWWGRTRMGRWRKSRIWSRIWMIVKHFDLKVFILCKFTVYLVIMILYQFGLYFLVIMNFLKSQSYNLQPQEYLKKFKNPHQVISTKGSEEDGKEHQQILEEILSKLYNDTQQSLECKKKAVESLNKTINQWIYENTDETLLPQYGLKIFGSYSLKANSYDGDIDMVCVVPEYFTRQKHFFGYLVEKLYKNPKISQVMLLPQAQVPLIKLNIYNVQIDLLMSRIPKSCFLQNPNFFYSMERSSLSDKELKSINGYRTSLYLQKKIKKFQNFQVALKALKMWATNKGIYSQIFGYLGGATISLMLAKISQLYPNYSSLQLIDRFFFIYTNWVWTIPVKLEEVQEETQSGSVISIYTPIEPHMNAGHLISRTTNNITRKYLKQAAKLIQQINKGNKPLKSLFQSCNFFNEYQSFLQISIMGKSSQDFTMWKGNIESKIRKFIQMLENMHQLTNSIEINFYPKAFQSNHPTFKYCNRYYIGFSSNIRSQVNDHYEIDLTQPVRNFLEILESYSGISKTPQLINIGCTYLHREEIPLHILENDKFYQ